MAQINKGIEGVPDLFEVFCHCPAWQTKWSGMLAHLKEVGEIQYRNHRLKTKKDKIVGYDLGGKMAFSAHKDDVRGLFLQCHNYLLDLWVAFWNAHKKGNACHLLKKTLLLQWPTDKVWVQMLNTPLPTAPIQTRYFPRLLAERKHALVLKKMGGCWVTRNGAPVTRVTHMCREEKKLCLEALMDLPLLVKIEIPSNMDFERLLPVLENIRRALKKPIICQRVKQKTGWNVAFRRIQGMGLKGCFDAASQTIVVDPRHPETLMHEMCHWMLGHGVVSVGKGVAAEKQVDELMGEVFG